MNRRQLSALLLLATIWGASFMFIKVMLEEMGPIAIGWLRLTGGAAFIVVVATVRGYRPPRNLRRWGEFFVQGALSNAIPFVLIPWGERNIDSSLAGILNAAMPLFVVLLAHRLLADERITRLRAAGVTLGFIGVVVVIGPDVVDIAKESTQGQLAVVLATLSYAAGAVWTRARLLDVDPTVLAGSQTVAAAVMLTPFLLVFEEVPVLWDLSPRVLWSALALALLASGLAMLIYFWLLSEVSATQVAMITYLAPAAALFWGWFVLDESVALAVVPGLALIVAGVILVTRAPAPVRSADPART
ncbi:MAG TPA: DMT family transporter [Dehalococcoidia bacterium]|nr:DMT family transporter [Dehalococcoidia bacterium]